MVLLPNLARLCLGRPTGMHEGDDHTYEENELVYYRRYGSFDVPQLAVIVRRAQDGRSYVIRMRDGKTMRERVFSVDPYFLQPWSQELQYQIEAEAAAAAAEAETEEEDNVPEQAPEEQAPEEQAPQEQGSSSTDPVAPEDAGLGNKADPIDTEDDDFPEEQAEQPPDYVPPPPKGDGSRKAPVRKRTKDDNRALTLAARTDDRFGVGSDFRTGMDTRMGPLRLLRPTSSDADKAAAEKQGLNAIIFLVEFITDGKYQKWTLEMLKNPQFINQFNILLAEWETVFANVKAITGFDDGYKVIRSEAFTDKLFRIHSTQSKSPALQQKRVMEGLKELYLRTLPELQQRLADLG